MELPIDQQADELDDRPVTCPFCGSDDTEPHALFGSTLLMTQHYCRSCHTVFERVRDDEPGSEAGSEAG
jgi:hypothetical protein